MASPIPSTTEPALRRVIGMGGLAAAIFNITIGAAIFVLPAHMAASLGAAAPLAYGICIVATALIALCIAEAGSRVAQSGGPYAFVQVALGPYVGYLCGVLLWLGVTLAMGAVATVLVDALATLVPALSGTVPRALVLVALFAGLATVNARGADWGSRLSGIATIAKLLPLLAFVVLGLSHVHGATLATPEAAKAPLALAAAQFAGPAGARLILVGMIVSTFGFMTGMMLSTPRTLFALASDGYLPRPLARVHPVHRTPHVAIAIQGVIVFVIALTGTYVKLALIADVSILLVYLACCLGTWRLRRDNVAADGSMPFRMPGGTVVPWLAAALIVGLLMRATAQAWLLTLGVVAVATLGFFVHPRRTR